MHSGSNRISINNPKVSVRKLCRFSDFFIYKIKKNAIWQIKIPDSPPRYEDVVRLPGARQTAEFDRKLKDLNVSREFNQIS